MTLHDVLLTYTFYNFDLGMYMREKEEKIFKIFFCFEKKKKKTGYVQGMNDLLSPIIVAMQGDESESFWW